MSKEIGRLLSHVLRHAPERLGITLDANGWTSVDELIAKARRAGFRIDRALLEETVATNDKQRFTLSEDRNKIRAAQGHSVLIDLGLVPSEPPAKLFHGTARTNLDAIFAEGLKAGRRQHVHLSMDEDTARRVGERHGKPVILCIDTKRMRNDGLTFLRADNGVWLTRSVLPQYLGF